MLRSKKALFLPIPSEFSKGVENSQEILFYLKVALQNGWVGLLLLLFRSKYILVLLNTLGPKTHDKKIGEQFRPRVKKR